MAIAHWTSFLTEGLVGAVALVKKPRRLEGFIDYLDQNRIAGWASYPGGVAPTLSVQVNGSTIERITPTQSRPDLAWLYPKNTQLGFDFAFPIPLAEGAIVAVIDRHGQKLGNSSRTVLAESKSGTLADKTLSTPLPDPELIFLVNGHRDKQQFAISRRATVTNIIELLSEAGIDYRNFESIMDFGCGCGRILAGWEGLLSDHTALVGCDINPKLIEFCTANIPFARTFISDFLPPINNVADAQFDFVYVASVFTHLTLPAARAWANELARVIKTNGILMVSYSGGYYEPILAKLSKRGLRELKKWILLLPPWKARADASRIKQVCDIREGRICPNLVQRV